MHTSHISSVFTWIYLTSCLLKQVEEAEEAKVVPKVVAKENKMNTEDTKFVRSKHVVITEVHGAYTKNTEVARR